MYFTYSQSAALKLQLNIWLPYDTERKCFVRDTAVCVLGPRRCWFSSSVGVQPRCGYENTDGVVK